MFSWIANYIYIRLSMKKLHSLPLSQFPRIARHNVQNVPIHKDIPVVCVHTVINARYIGFVSPDIAYSRDRYQLTYRYIFQRYSWSIEWYYSFLMRVYSYIRIFVTYCIGMRVYSYIRILLHWYILTLSTRPLVFITQYLCPLKNYKKCKCIQELLSHY